MEPNYLEPDGVRVDPSSLTITRASDLVTAIKSGRLDFVRLVECRHCNARPAAGDADIVVVDLDVQRPQLTVNDVRLVERVAIVFTRDDDSFPDVLVLRSDFPLVPHTNWRAVEFPRSLCIYEQGWDEVRIRWTPSAFIERIRRWFADTAMGTLHRDDQPLEPLLFGTPYRLVIPADMVKVNGEAAEKLDVTLVPTSENSGTLIARRSTGARQPGDGPKFIASMFFADSRQHGVIRHAPRNLEDLADFVKGEQFDLLAELRDRLKRWKDDGCLNASLIIVIAFPLQRQGDVEAEINDLWAFITLQSVFEIGKKLGVWDKVRDKDGWTVGVFLAHNESCRGSDIALDTVRPHFSLSRVAAAAASGVEPVPFKILAVGVGALGSQVVLNLVRGGFGIWSLIDDDELLPHNVARHASPAWGVGLHKVEAVGAMIDACFEDEPPVKAIAANILRPGCDKPAVYAALAQADIILDLSASVPVARYLARDTESAARRISLFLSPRGLDLVCLSEDPKRGITLDCLEMQYYRALIRDERLAGHLEENASRIRYARSCRDVSFSLPTHLVAINGGIGAHAVRTAATMDEAAIHVWRSDAATCAVTLVRAPVSAVYRATIGEWTVVLDEGLFEMLTELRSSKLPNETGGVLIGAYDLVHKTVYVVDTIPSPPDSEEWPTLYIRGSDGLRESVARVTATTAGQLEYVGEWHSHPDGCSCLPSRDDMKVFSWMTDRMSAAGLPALMAIVGEQSASSWFIARMNQDGGWVPARKSL
ncbi:MAG: Mov34/MPN/PAD-1 family protein [Gemmataceae bacterium]